ncbi:hypothetical protein M011DRAFT_411115 [Sporormia fimetaria CBS 119925]|uniref:PH domain-containing protein n=1 Tax=Sporormia fimetaria CBS 119925 TaxID=1340428 RepID=A0A6A6UZM7_9PLEO|nr:hypothetical protein M011DRAFT_411115 [Sporormia fimetaria CBS 119925]
MATETAAPPSEGATALTSFLRYRSVRRAQAQPQPPQPVPAPPVPQVPPIEQLKDKTDEAPVSRSMSRYHRRPTVSHQTAPPVPSLNGGHAPPNATAPSAQIARNRALSSPQNQTAHEERKISDPSERAREEARQILEGETDRHQIMQQRIKAEQRAKLEALEKEQERVKREQARRADEEASEELRRQCEAAELDRQRREKEEQEYAVRQRRQKEEQEQAERQRRRREEQDHAERQRREREEHEHGRRLQKSEGATRLRKNKSQPLTPPTSPPRHGGGFSLFGRRRRDDASLSPEHSKSLEPLSDLRSAHLQKTEDRDNRDMEFIPQGGGGAVIDAPKSAINAGERRVLVVRNKQEILLPITPTTTPLDLIKSASNCLTDPIQVSTAVILESFQKVGLKRPLRNYEHVRDVMNSWDHDKENDLHIVDALFHDINQAELLVSNVPTTKPPGYSCYLNYSSKPGKWSKRHFTLTGEGQLSMAKSESAKDRENICHLSDFDIYIPTERKLSKVRPPKKICYAVKSQQKANIYIDETRFVHFVCTNDKNIAASFWKAVQGWRSWYLVHVMGEGQKKSKPSEAKLASSLEPAHARNTSVSSHYQLGSFKPLLDLDQFSKEPQQDAVRPGPLPESAAAPLSRMDSRSMHARKMSMRANRPPPPLSYTSGSESESETFAAGGLLGRKYTERQQALQEIEASQKAFTEGPSLVNNTKVWNAPGTGNEGGLARHSSVRSHHRTSSDIQRSISTRARPRPLVDLTPQYQEPPQHARKGKGFYPEGNAGPLVENATSVDEAIKVPSSTDWRRPPTVHRNNVPNGGSAYERTRSLKGRGEGLAAYAANINAAAAEDSRAAFTGGLLARATGFSQGHTPVGHGVMDGSRAKGPMVDLREDSKFASGSLLAKVESQQGPSGPVLDRTRRQSIDIG